MMFCAPPLSRRYGDILEHAISPPDTPETDGTSLSMSMHSLFWGVYFRLAHDSDAPLRDLDIWQATS